MSDDGSYRNRLCDGYLTDLLAEFPAVMINGARAIGKTTTAAQHVVGHIVRLDEPGTALSCLTNGRKYLRYLPRSSGWWIAIQRQVSSS